MSDVNAISHTYSPSGFLLPPDYPLIKGGIVITHKDIAAFLGDVPAHVLKQHLTGVRSALGLRRSQPLTVYQLAQVEGWNAADSAAILDKWRRSLYKSRSGPD